MDSENQSIAENWNLWIWKLVADSFDEMTTKKFKLHVYNIFRQYSELKHLKKTLGEEEVILSVDFSRNYKNKQCHEIENAYFGHEAFPLCTAAYYVKGDTDKALKSTTDKDTSLVVLPVVIISNQTIHERNIAFPCNGMLIDYRRHSSWS